MKTKTPKIARWKRAKSSITQPWIIWFRSNFVQSLNAWRPKSCRSSRSRGERSRSQHNITYQHKNAIIQAQICCRSSNLVKIIPEPSATRNAMFKVIKSNTEIAITPPRIALLRSFFTSQAKRCKCSRSKNQRSRSRCKVTYQQQNTIIRQWIGSATSNLAWCRNWSGNYWRGSGGLKLQCIRNCHVFWFLRKLSQNWAQHVTRRSRSLGQILKSQ